ncbi:MAG: hypothetical protein J6T32_05035 [Paludibacteraceae bacterium]|nr:hypothetical protein [Paludibacteraceae bacterium]
MKAKALFFLCGLMLFTSACTKRQITLTDDNFIGFTTADVIAYLQDYQQQLNSDSLAQTIDQKEQIMNDIKGWAEASEKIDQDFDVSEHDTTPINLRATIPFLDSVLTQAIGYLDNERGTDYLDLMEENWENFTILGPMAQTMNNLNLLTVAYTPFYWATYADNDKDTIAFYNAFYEKLDILHFTARMTSLMHEPPVPYPAYIESTRMGMYCLENLGKYSEALEWANTYLVDLHDWDFYRPEQLYEIDKMDSHRSILLQMRDCYAVLGDDDNVAVINQIFGAIFGEDEKNAHE